MGANGFLGIHLYNYLKTKYKIIRLGRKKNSDFVLKKITKYNFLKILKKNLPDVIINLIAITNVDLCENRRKKAEEINSKIVKNTVKAINEINSKKRIFFLQISTDQVYSGKGPHKEKFAKPVNTYGKTKLNGERYIKNINGCILRTNFVGKSLKNDKKSFTDWIFNSLKNGKTIPVFKNIKFSPLSTETLCKYINLVIKKKIKGIYNLGSKNGMSKAEFAINFAKKLNLDTKLLKVTNYKKEFLIAKRPLDMRMNVKFFERKFRTRLKSLNYEINLISKCYRKY